MVMLPSSVIHKPAAAGGSSYLDSVASSTCCDLDATISASYAGSGQTWANLIASPADTAAQTAYDFYLGINNTATTDDPTFTGSAGSSSAYFAMDGGDYFTLKSLTSSVPTFWNLARSSQQFWFAYAFRTPTTGTWSATQGFFGNAWTTTNVGTLYYSTTAEPAIFGIANDVGANTQTVAPNSTFLNSTDYLCIISVDTSTGTNNVRSWVNATTASTFSKTWATTTNDPDGNFHIGALSNAGTVQGIAQNGVRIYHFSCGNAFINDTTAAAIVSHLNTRHGRTYA